MLPRRHTTDDASRLLYRNHKFTAKIKGRRFSQTLFFVVARRESRENFDDILLYFTRDPAQSSLARQFQEFANYEAEYTAKSEQVEELPLRAQSTATSLFTNLELYCTQGRSEWKT